MYGITDTGFRRKRMDVIIQEVQNELTQTLGFDVASNPNSFLNVFITTFCGRVAELWEVAEGTYYNMFPASASGVSLDNVVQFAGITRERARKTRCTILCTGADGTLIPAGTRICSNTTPSYFFGCEADTRITRNYTAKVEGKNPSSTTISSDTYTIAIDGTQISVTDASGALWTMLASLATNINAASLGVTATADGTTFKIVSDDMSTSHALAYNEALESAVSLFQTRSITTPIMFASDEYGKIVVPSGSINTIVSNIAGFSECVDYGTPDYGRLEQTDSELRLSFIAKIATRADMNIESIRSAIMQCNGVESCSVTENNTDTATTYVEPHSFECVVKGGVETDIARAILRHKPAGISTSGTQSVSVAGTYAGTVNVHFTRPTEKKVWLKVMVESDGVLPVNYETLIKEAIIAKTYEIGENVRTQAFIPSIIGACTNIAYLDILACESETEPDDEDYTEHLLTMSEREFAVLDADRITVVVDNE